MIGKLIHGSSAAVLAGVILVGSASGQIAMPEPASIQEAMKIWKEWGNRPSIWKRFMGYRAVALVRTEDGRKLLTSLYRRPGEHPEANRTLISRLLRNNYAGQSDWEELEKLLDKNDKPRDWWLWHELMAMRMERGQQEDVLATIRNEKLDPELRAAAIHSIAVAPKAVGREPILTEIPEIALAFTSKKEHEVATMQEAPLGLWSRIGLDPYDPMLREAVRPYVDMLDDQDIPMRRRIVISRALATIFKQPNLGLMPGPWTNYLDTPKPEEGKDEPKRFARFSTKGTSAGFFGINEISKRVVFVIDASDSMLKPITEREKTWLKPVSSGGDDEETEGEDEGDNKPSDAERAIETALPWDKINNRWEATIEFVRLSCERMSAEQSFAIVLFGDDAEALETTPRLMPADPRIVAKAIQELRDIRIGGPANNRPHGTLKGKTNLHGGIHMAYRITEKKGVLRDQAGNHPLLFEGGADTVFVLSDGDPNWDDLAERDSLDEGDTAGDVEGGGGKTKVRTGTFQGPFRYMEWMMWDLQRLNTLRNARIHLVGFGEANRKTLDAIATVGGGQTLMIGQR